MQNCNSNIDNYTFLKIEYKVKFDLRVFIFIFNRNDSKFP